MINVNAQLFQQLIDALGSNVDRNPLFLKFRDALASLHPAADKYLELGLVGILGMYQDRFLAAEV